MAAAVERPFTTRVEDVNSDLAHLFRAHHERVLRAAFRITGSMADAEDVAQTVFLRFAQSNASVAGVANPDSYFYRAAINAALDLLRKRQRDNTVPLEVVSENGVADVHVDDSAEAKQRLRTALAQLDPKAAEMFAMRYLEECDLGEIARAFNTSRAVVAVTLHRTRNRLRKQFANR